MSKMLTREQIYEMVWSTPVKTLAATFSISDVALRKRCQKLDIPLPPAGYWSKLRAGKKTIRPLLPPRGPGMLAQVDFDVDLYGYRWRPIPDEELLGPVPDPPVFDEPLETVRGRYVPKIGTIRVARDLTEALPAIKTKLTEDEALRVRMKGKGYISIFDLPRFDSPFGSVAV